MANISQQTLDVIHREYQIAVKKSSSLVDILENLYSQLLTFDVPAEDQDPFIRFLDALQICIGERKMTFIITDFMTDMNSVIMYMILFANDKYHLNLDVNWFSRRKALESDLTKMLNKAITTDDDPIYIRDRFGIRGILLNRDSDENNIEKLYKLDNIIFNVLTRPNSSIRKHFEFWFQNSDINSLAKSKIQFMLGIPFSLKEGSYRDFIKNPKENGYQSLHATYEILCFSKFLPGVKFEVQLRDLRMHNIAEKGSAAHDEYKNELDESIKQTFRIEDSSTMNLPGFTCYEEWDKDMAGLHFAKHFSDRRNSI